jgi:hypothetical protein
MKDLIKALQIFSKYSNSDVICCEHDTLHICIDPEEVSSEDLAALEKLSFCRDGAGGFSSYRFGSC